MHVGLNIAFLTPGEQGGMETYVRELLPALAQRGARLTSFVNRVAAEAGGPWSEAGEQVVLDLDARNRLQWVRAEQQLVPRLARRHRVDVLHSLASTGPLWGSTPRVTTVHDLNYLKVPGTHFGARGLGMRVLVPAAARRSRRVIVDAESTRRDLVEELGLAADRIDVAQLAAGPGPAVAPTPEPELRSAFDLGRREVLLSVSAKRPHKNLARLIRAWAALAPELRPVLVIPGYATEYERELWELATGLGVAGDLRMPAWLEQTDLEGLYAISTASVFPSLYEGFGLPVLEAMRRGLPVACSDRSSLPEVAGSAALMFDPEDEGAIRSALERLLTQPELREQLRAAGLEQAGRFTWDATARATLASYERALA